MEFEKSAREVALLALSAFERQGAWSDGFLKKSIRSAGLSGRDAALCTRLCFGVLQNRMRLDFYLSQFSSVPLEKLEERVLQSLRLGAYQICDLDRVPASAAVNESVKLARKYARHPRAAGLVNGVLRNLVRNRASLPVPPDLAVQYSHPDWLTEALIQQLGREGAEALMAENNGQPPTCAQVNTCRFTTREVCRRLEEAGSLSRGGLLHPGPGGPAGCAGGTAPVWYADTGRLRRPWRQVLCRRAGHGGHGEYPRL